LYCAGVSGAAHVAGQAERPTGEAALEADVVAGLLTVFFDPAVVSPF
jgi:hypothetical protein